MKESLKVKELFAAMKALSAYDVAMLNSVKDRPGDQILALLTSLDDYVCSDGLLYGCTPEELHTAKAQKIRAIKMYRERTGSGLRDAKDAIEHAVAQQAMQELRGLEL